MGYLFKKNIIQDKIILELKTKNFYIFATIVFLSLIPAVYIVALYFSDNVNLFRIPYVLFIIIMYAILDGGAIIKNIIYKKQSPGRLCA